MNNRVRVLVDLSAALREQAGIPRVVRQLAWLLSTAPEIEPAGLVLSIHWNSRADRFARVPPSAHAVAEDAEFLADALSDQGASDFLSSRLLSRFFRRTLGDRVYPLIPIQAHFLDDVLWENYFAPSLPASCRKLFDRFRFYRSPLTRREMTTRVRHRFFSARLDTTGFDFAVFQNGAPVNVSPGTTKIIRLHDMVPLFRFDTQPDERGFTESFIRALDESARDSHFVCVSEATREELISFRPALASRTSVIPNSLPLPRHVSTRETQPGDYFLAVGTIEPRKNYLRLLDGFRLYRRTVTDPRPLVLVGNPGWRNDAELREIRSAVREGWLTWLKGVSPDRLTELYANAHALVAASVHEGFGYPPLEAAGHGVPSVLSDLKVFRGHFGESAEYFDPYDPAALREALIRLDSGRRAELSPRVLKLSQRFHPGVELEQWRGLFDRLKAEKR